MKKYVFTLAVTVGILLVVNSLFMIGLSMHRAQSDLTTLEGNFVKNIFSEEKGLSIESALIGDRVSSDSFSVESAIIDRDASIVIRDGDTARKPKPIKPKDEADVEAPITSYVPEVLTYNDKPLVLDKQKGTITYNGREIPVIVDPVVDANGVIIDDTATPETKNVDAWVNLTYERFTVHIDEAYYNANGNGPDLVAFFDEFALRFDVLESRTGWSSEQFYGEKLDIYVTSTTGCRGGFAYLTEAHVRLHDDLDDGVCEVQHYHQITLHEALHAINPLPVYVRDWLTEGFSQYEEHNTLVQQGDILQNQADNLIFGGSSSYNWADYVANDFRDTTSSNLEIQESEGYDITAWMFTMMREDHSMTFSDLYALLNNNYETLDKADSMWQTSDYFTDMVVIDLFGRAAGYNFSETKNIWEYDGPSGPGWGVRNWVDTSWYADLEVMPSLTRDPPTGDITTGESVSLSATVSNTGGTNLTGVVVRFSANDNVFDEQVLDLDAGESVPVSATYATVARGEYTLTIAIDPDNVKLESDESNNEASEQITVVNPPSCTGGYYDKETGEWVPVRCI